MLLTTQLTNLEIAKKYDVSENIICGINTGYYWKDKNTTYPLRKTYSNGGLKKKERFKQCPLCGKLILFNSSLCFECEAINRQKIERPSAENLKELLMNLNGNFSAVGQKFNVSDNMIRKWCKKNNMSTSSKSYKTIKPPRGSPIPSKSVNQIDKNSGKIIATYSSIEEAKRATNIEHIGQVCSGKRNTAGGYKWEFVNRDNKDDT